MKLSFMLEKHEAYNWVKTDKFISPLETNQPQTVIVDQRKSEAVEKWWRLVFQINMNPDLFRMETNQLDVLAEP